MIRFLLPLLTNWKTTVTGALTIASAFIPGGPVWLPAVIAGIGQVVSRDADKTSEASGAK